MHSAGSFHGTAQRVPVLPATISSIVDPVMAASMDLKSIDFRSGTGAMPGLARGNEKAARAFRDAARLRIEAALDAYGAGLWGGADMGGGAVHFGFSVADSDGAETIVREAVEGTDLAAVHHIERIGRTAPDPI